MSEIIIKIDPTFFQIQERCWEFTGYEITTNNQTIQFGIQAGQSCCENYGYFSSEDNLNEFIGAELLDIQLTDTALNTNKLKEQNLSSEVNLMFVTFKTNKGVFQLTVYNDHNGYYGHDAVIISQKLKVTDNL